MRRLHRHFGCSLLVLAASGLTVSTANAGPGAPIVYGKARSAQTAPSAPLAAPSQATPAPSAATTSRSARISFRYPGDVGALDRAPGTATALTPPPAPVSVTPVAPQVATMPQAAASVVMNESFEAAPQPIRVASTTPLKSASPQRFIGQPLQLSKIVSTPDAELKDQFGQVGIYSDGFEGKPTANGEVFDVNAMTAAHPSFPLPSLVQVTNEATQQEVVVRVNDRGPFQAGRTMDVSPRAADMLGLNKGQTAPMRLRYLGPAPVIDANANAWNSKSVAQAAPAQPAITPVALTEPRPFEPIRVQSMDATPEPVQRVETYAAPEVYFIQAGAFADIGNAQRLVSRLGRAYPVDIEQARVNGGDYFRVIIGPYTSRERANSEQASLERMGMESGFIVER